ncbi:MAG TPA: response regulator [Polyangiaceae bacterium]|jgi:DNA-binding response OmpR family regulator|nr:response regulator [Polyangiaceae bacterium]
MPDDTRAKRTILVVDDSEVVLEMTRFTLEQAGFRVLTRDRAQGSIVAILHEQPDLVLLDVNMPSMSGESIAEILSRARPARGTTIVLYSSLPANALRMKVLATGAHGFIQKTSVQVDLIRQVKAFFEPSESQSKLRRAALNLSEEVSLSSARIRAASAVDEQLSVAPPSSGALESSDPALQPSSASAPPPQRTSGTLRLNIPTALFVDDDITILSAYRRSFSSDELSGEYLTSAEQASRRIAAPAPPDVVVTDLVFPGMNGIELYRRAVELDPTFRHRFVFVTGAQSLSHIAAFLREVGGRALEKPIDMRRLRDAIRYSATGARIFRKHSAEG